MWSNVGVCVYVGGGCEVKRGVRCGIQDGVLLVVIRQSWLCCNSPLSSLVTHPLIPLFSLTTPSTSDPNTHARRITRITHYGSTHSHPTCAVASHLTHHPLSHQHPALRPFLYRPAGRTAALPPLPRRYRRDRRAQCVPLPAADGQFNSSPVVMTSTPTKPADSYLGLLFCMEDMALSVSSLPSRRISCSYQLRLPNDHKTPHGPVRRARRRHD